MEESIDLGDEAKSPPPGFSPDIFSIPPAPLNPFTPNITDDVEASDTVKPEIKKYRSWVWEHFKKLPCIDKRDQKAMCLYCNMQYVAAPSKGTSNLSNHLKCCKRYPPNVEKNQKLLAYQSALRNDPIDSENVLKGSHLCNWSFNSADHRKSLAEMIVLDELPFRFVEREGFRRYMQVTQPKAVIPSRTTVARDILELFMKEKKKLSSFFKKNSVRVCLTTDAWSSCQNLGYMVLTAHFIDKNWKLQKKIINFCPIAGHSGEVIGRSIERCLLDWNIDKILTITVDNASSNDKCVDYLRERLNCWGGSVLDGSCLHVRCAAHILSLVVKEGLRDSSDHILRVRFAVRYVRSSPARMKKFKTCVEQEKIVSKKLLCLDVETRWNSTYLMLDAALQLRKAFDLLKRDKKYRDEMEKLKGVPTDDDWDHIRVLLPFLESFYDTTLRISGSLYVTGNMYLQEIVAILNMICIACDGDDFDMGTMALSMKRKYDKYWGGSKNTNVLLFVAVILDPRRKMKYVEWAINKFFGAEVACELLEKVKDTLKKLFEFYASKVHFPSTPHQSSVLVECENDIGCHMLKNVRDMTEKEFQDSVQAIESSLVAEKTDLDRYLEEKLYATPAGRNFDILSWWKHDGKCFEVLSLMAKDVLAMPISTVASESAFSTGGRVLDSFRSSLTPRMVEALICTQDWLRSSREHFCVEERLEDLNKIEEDVKFLPSMLEIDESDITEFDDIFAEQACRSHAQPNFSATM